MRTVQHTSNFDNLFSYKGLIVHDVQLNDRDATFGACFVASRHKSEKRHRTAMTNPKTVSAEYTFVNSVAAYLHSSHTL